ncbi:MAG: aldo/keto reductase [Nitrospira defluvii]|nr:aldo/keto reductase [Nitrospira defluvii]
MQYRKLGNTGFTPSVLGFGCSMIASLATRYSRAEVEASLCEARDAGITFFDTADVYGQGDSERLLGKLFRSRGEGMILCTKAGLTVGPMEYVVRLVKPAANVLLRRWRATRVATTQARHQQERQCFDPDYLSRRIEGSLYRLNVDRIDLFLLHNPPVDVPQRDAVFELLARFKAQGKLRQFGVSCRSLDDAYVWLGQPDVACVQIPIDRSRIEAAIPVLARARLQQVGVIAREVFAHDVLAKGSVSDALRPLLHRPEIDVVLAGMTCRRHLRENVHAVERAMECGHVA